MNVINIFGGPGVGKTTLMYYLTYRFKQAGIRAEAVGEAARELIYDHSPLVTPPILSDHQFVVSAMQFERLQRLKRHKIAVAISDSPLLQGLAYATPDEQKQLTPIIDTMNRSFLNRYIFVKRTPGDYDAESRVQGTESEAARFDARIKALLDTRNIVPAIYLRGTESSLADMLIDTYQHVKQ